MTILIPIIKKSSLKLPLTAGATTVVTKLLKDQHDNLVTLATFGEFGTIVVKQGDVWECIKFTGLVNDEAGNKTTLTVATNGRHILPVSPYTGQATGFDFNTGEVIVTNDPLVMSTFANLENANTFNEVQTFAVSPIVPTATTAQQAINKAQMEAQVNLGAADASTTTKGIAKASVAPASATEPIFVGDNDGRVPTQAENDALAGTAGTPSGTNKFVTASGLQSQVGSYYASAVGTDSYAITPSPSISAYATGMKFSFLADVANTGACTLAVSGLSALAIKKLNDQDLITGDIEAGQIIEVVYDGTDWQMQSQMAQLQASAPIVYAAGEHTFISSDGVVLGSTTSYVKVKEIAVTGSGTITVYFELKTPNPGETAVARIYKNGTGVGTVRSTSSGTYVAYSENISSIVAGDLIQIYAHQTVSADSAYVQNFRLKINKAFDGSVVNL